MSQFLLFVITMIAAIPSFALRDLDMQGQDSLQVNGSAVGAKLVYTFDERYCNGSPTAAENVAVGCQATVSGTSAYSSIASALDLFPNNDGNRNLGTNGALGFKVSSKFKYVLLNYQLNGIEGGDDMVDMGYQNAQNHRSLLKSSSSPYVNGALGATCTDEMTVQIYVRPLFPFHGNNDGNMIVGITNSTSGAAAVPDWALYQVGNNGSERVRFRVRNGNNSKIDVDSPVGVFSSIRDISDVTTWNGFEAAGTNSEILDTTKWTEIIATIQRDPIDNQRRATVYVNRVPSASIPVSYTPAGSLSSSLVLGNDLVAIGVNNDNTSNLDNQKNWSGLVKHMAVYCNGVARTDVLGTVAIPGTQSQMAAIQPLIDTPISSERSYAQRLAQRLTGVLMPIDHPDIISMEALIKSGDALGAAQIITGDKQKGLKGNSLFLNVVVKQMAIIMSNREETARAPLNDMAASFIGVTRDETSAKELLTGDFYYVADPNIAKVRNNFAKDILLSNNHYADLDNGDWDIGRALMRVDANSTSNQFPKGQQVLLDPVLGTYSPSPDPAGVITSRAWMSAHAIAGTNRRLVEYSLREFLCVPLQEAADTSASDARIGRDVDRAPGGDESKFQTSCKGCHTIQDGMRGAFAYWDFRTSRGIDGNNYDFVRNSLMNNPNHDASGTGTDKGCINSNGSPVLPGIDKVIYKMNHNCDVFNNISNALTDDSFVNNAKGFKNKALFGWRGDNLNGGNGTGQFGRMVSDSKRFSQCMAKRVYESVCLPAMPYDFNEVRDKVFSYANTFEEQNYNLKKLFQMIAVDPICIKMR